MKSQITPGMSGFLQNTFGLSGKTALVTGGARGLGRMIAESLLQAGARVCISSRSAKACEEAAQEMSEFGECFTFPHDLSRVEGICALASDLEAAGYGLDILVNNSGAAMSAPVDEFPEVGWDKVMNLNVKSPFFLVQKLLPLLEASASEQNPARIINIGSVAGLTVGDTQQAYAYMTSKAAILHLTKGLAKDLASRHITVNGIAPGFFPSKMTTHLTDDDSVLARTLAKVPLGRLGAPQEIGGLIIYLGSAAGAYMTGSLIPITGGSDLG